MAEAAMFSVAAKLLSTVSSPAFEKAYERVRSIWDARDELEKLKRSIQTIQVVLLDAEKKQDSSAAIKDWIKRVRDVLYDAEDLFDEVTTDDMLKQQIIKGGNKILSKVRVSCFKLNPIVSRDSIAKKVKVIRKSLLEISTDMAQFEFVICQHEAPVSGLRKGKDPGCFVDSKDVFGREEDKKAILQFLFDESYSVEPNLPFVIAIVGIGGMGKTTLAQLVYNDEEVEKKFEKRWFACISDTSDEKEVLGKIFQSICNRNYSGLTVSQLQTDIREAMKGIKNFLLVLDDVWDEDHGRWQDRMSLIRNGSSGHKIIVTTRSLSVARVVGASIKHNLDGLSDDESWNLFKRVAFTPEQEIDSRWIELGREIVKKCANVPLAIRSIGSLLYTKTTIQEWKSFRDQELSKLAEQSGDSIMNTLKLSYEHLPSNLKHCFAYCALFPKDHYFVVQKLIYFWVAQGYVKPFYESQNVEEAGHSYFMDLFRRSFFQEAEYDEHGEIRSCKMHDLIHDLAQSVSGEEICMLNVQSNHFKESARHVRVVCEPNMSWEVLSQLNTNRVRSVLSCTPTLSVHLTLDEQLTKFKYLRTLSLPNLGIHSVSTGIGELKHLRFIDLSLNNFECLPDSITNLLNLLVLDLSWCKKLRALPDKFRKLINLRLLNIELCIELKHMPPGFEELSCLQYLTNFEVGKTSEGVEMSGLNALVGIMPQLRGRLYIKFDRNTNEWDGDECLQLPMTQLHTLRIHGYPGRRMEIIDPCLISNLASLHLFSCSKLKYLGSISLLPNLKSLQLLELWELEYLEEEEDDEGRHKKSCIGVSSTNTSTFFPSLVDLELYSMRKLKGWRRKVASTSSTIGEHDPPLFPSLSALEILSCPELKSIPLCPRLERVSFEENVGIQHLLESVRSNTSSLLDLYVSFSDLMSLHLTSLHVKEIHVVCCYKLFTIQVDALPTLLSLSIKSCQELKNLHIARLTALEELEISACPQLELWEEEEEEDEDEEEDENEDDEEEEEGEDVEKRCHIDWDSLPKLRELRVDIVPPPEKLPESLLCRQALGKLQFKTKENSYSDLNQ